MKSFCSISHAVIVDVLFETCVYCHLYRKWPGYNIYFRWIDLAALYKMYAALFLLDSFISFWWWPPSSAIQPRTSFAYHPQFPVHCSRHHPLVEKTNRLTYFWQTEVGVFVFPTLWGGGEKRKKHWKKRPKKQLWIVSTSPRGTVRSFGPWMCSSASSRATTIMGNWSWSLGQKKQRRKGSSREEGFQIHGFFLVEGTWNQWFVRRV